MLHCTMDTPTSARGLQLDLEDILGSLNYARKQQDLGRLAFLTYWEVRRWARAARLHSLAERAGAVITDHPHVSREALLAVVDEIICDLEQVHRTLH